jgi:uncharacterized membrane protein
VNSSDQQLPAEAAPSGEVKPSRRPPLRVRVIRIIAILCIAAFVYAWYRGSHVDEGTPTAEELQGGPISQIVHWRNTRHTAVQHSRLCSEPADYFWKVVTDQEQFDDFMPYVEYTKVRQGPNDTRLEEQRLALPFGDKELELEITMTHSGNARTAFWRQLKGSLTFNEGAWVVEKSDDKTILRYQVAAAVKYMPQWVINYAMRKRLGNLLIAVERRVQQKMRDDPSYFNDLSTTPGLGGAS